jgi:hypothetical protein
MYNCTSIKEHAWFIRNSLTVKPLILIGQSCRFLKALKCHRRVTPLGGFKKDGATTVHKDGKLYFSYQLWGLYLYKDNSNTGNAKCRHLKKLTCKVTLRQVFTCLRLRTPSFPHTHIIHYTCSKREGDGEGRIVPERMLEGKQFIKPGRKYQHDWLYVQSINSEKHLLQSPFTGDDILLWCRYSL